MRQDQRRKEEEDAGRGWKGHHVRDCWQSLSLIAFLFFLFLPVFLPRSLSRRLSRASFSLAPHKVQREQTASEFAV